VTELGGTVTITSEPGAGTEVEIVVPSHEAEAGR
jgi:signal transduction histidine kinase